MSEFHTKPNPAQPDRCPSIDPHDELQCTRRIHEDDQCVCGGIGWKKGTPRYISDREKAGSALLLAKSWENCECQPVCWHRRAAKELRDALAGLTPAPPVTVPEPEGGDEG
jgi:hypothetical protein